MKKMLNAEASTEAQTASEDQGPDPQRIERSG